MEGLQSKLRRAPLVRQNLLGSPPARQPLRAATAWPTAEVACVVIMSHRNVTHQHDVAEVACHGPRMTLIGVLRPSQICVCVCVWVSVSVSAFLVIFEGGLINMSSI